MATKAAVVDDLLALEDGDMVTLECSGYEWSNPFEVVVEQDVMFEAPTGDAWQARRIRLEPESARASDRTFRAVEGLDAPYFGPGYGPLVGVDVETPDDDEDGGQIDPALREDAVLDILEEHGPMQAMDLREAVAERLDISPGWAKQIPQYMAEDGDLARWTDPENRSHTYYGLSEHEPEGLEEPEPFYPTECGTCGATLADSIEEAVHHTEEHGSSRADFDYLEPGEFEAAVEDADTVAELAEHFSWGSTKTLQLLGIYGLEDVVCGDVELTNLTDIELDGLDEQRRGGADA